MNKVNCGKDESWSRMLTMREDDVQNTWNIYSEDLYNVNTEEWVTVNMHSFDGTRKGNYFGSNED